jgi:drug/metabolite transporter (DMT)-like permease
VATLLALRFGLATTVLAGARAAARAPAWDALRSRTALIAFLLGATAYAVAAIGYFQAVTELDPGTASIIVYCYPAIVVVAGAALGWERLTPRAGVAALAAMAGVGLVSASGGDRQAGAAGVAFAVASAVGYAAYLLASSRLVTRPIPGVVLAGATCAGAFATIAIVGAAGAIGGLSADFAARGLLIAAGLALLSTALPIAFTMAGLTRVGPTVAAVLGAAEPVVAVALAAAVFGTLPTSVQGVGAVLVLGGVIAIVTGRPAVTLPSSASTSVAPPCDEPSTSSSIPAPPDGRP